MSRSISIAISKCSVTMFSLQFTRSFAMICPHIGFSKTVPPAIPLILSWTGWNPNSKLAWYPEKQTNRGASINDVRTPGGKLLQTLSVTVTQQGAYRLQSHFSKFPIDLNYPIQWHSKQPTVTLFWIPNGVNVSNTLCTENGWQACSFTRNRVNLASWFTEMRFNLCTWLGEISSCSCLGPA